MHHSAKYSTMMSKKEPDFNYDPGGYWSKNTAANTGYPITVTEGRCRMCGNRWTWMQEGVFDIRMEIKCCNDCTARVINRLADAVIPEFTKLLCETCRSHIDACACPNKKAVQKLKL